MNPIVMLIENDENLNYILTHFLEKNNFNVISFTNGDKAIKSVTELKFEIAVIDVNLGEITGFEILRKIKKYNSYIPAIMITAYANINDAIKAIKEGAYDYLVKPFKEIELVHHIQNALKSTRLEIENIRLKDRLSLYEIKEKIVGKSDSMKKLRDIIMDVAENDVNVFILGETGTGKELVAQALYKNSKRADAPFVPINCAAIPATLLESEFFGYVKGAFTGAVNNRKGKFEIANNGTIFLDEITEMPYNLQAKLLRVIQEKEFEAIGSNKTIKINVRFISASNKNVEDAIKQGNFREDLFYRLNIFPINIPPLREHKEDISILIQHFFKKNNYGEIKVTKEALKKLMNYEWPGNVRELENALSYAIISSKKDVIDISHLPEKILNYSNVPLKHNGKTLDEYEYEIILNSLRQNNGNQTKTAGQLGITRSVLIYKMKKLGIKPKIDY